MENQISRDIGEVMRDGMIMKDRIITLVSEAPRTIPEIAAALEYPAYEVMYWIMAMWRYGFLEEAGKPDVEGYYKYKRDK